MRIILDCMGGDNPAELFVIAAAAAVREYSVDITLVGDEGTIQEAILHNNLSTDHINVIHSDIAINMEDPALSVVREKNGSSMSIGLRQLAEGKGDAFVSAGNTGALLAGATFIVRRIKGLRAAIATTLPLEQPTLLIDSGANISVTSDNLVQFGMMGSIYAQKLLGVKNPRVGLVNIGSERTKGTPLLVETYEKLEKSELNFVGNIEGRDIPFAKCDVLVCDGFTGNVVLKMVEGMGSFLLGKLKDVYSANVIAKASAVMIRKNLKEMKSRFDTTEYGGAPLIGLAKPVIKAHGGSDAKAVKNAIRQAINYCNTGIIFEIAERTESLVPKSTKEG